MPGGLDPAGREVLRQFARLPQVISGEAQKQLRQAAEEAAAKTKDAIRSAASEHPGSLREEIAATVNVSRQTRTGGATITIASSGRRMPPGKRNLAAYADGEPPYSRWRHPVWGHEDRWVSQNWETARGWFTRTLSDEREHFAAAAQAALDEAARKAGGE